MLPTAVMLGALHALEPGHSKSMMAAFIVAIQGTVRQAVLLALSATVGHTIVVWVLAFIAWRLGESGFLERVEPWLLLIGGFLLVALALRILVRLNRQASQGHHHAHDHDHAHLQSHDHSQDHAHHHAEDTHAAAHVADIKNRFTGGAVTNGDVIWFGFSGGLLPCPAAFAVLLACLHQKAYALGIVMVAAFSIGLALMLVAIGAAAAWGADAIRSRLSAFDQLTLWAPYVSATIVLAIGLIIAAQGARSLGLA